MLCSVFITCFTVGGRPMARLVIGDRHLKSLVIVNSCVRCDSCSNLDLKLIGSHTPVKSTLKLCFVNVVAIFF